MYYNPMTNQLLRQKDQIDNLLQQYNQPTPIQNFINTTGLDFEAKILTNGEDISNIMINRRTLFVDEKNSKVLVKETDGSISKTYDIIVPKDEKDLKIEELEKEINKLKEVIGDGESISRIKSATKVEQSDGNVTEHGGQ